MTHDPLCKGGDCTCTCDQLQEGHRRGCPGEDCDCLFIAEIRADERVRSTVTAYPTVKDSSQILK